MKSYASIGEIDDYTVCEVELNDTDESKTLSAREKKTSMVEFNTQAIINCVGSISEGDILVVEQEEGRILVIYGKDEEEKQRRINLLRRLMAK